MPRKLYPQDYVDILDRALDAAESELRKGLTRGNLPKARKLADMFKQHVETHLTIELQNIAHHGNKQDA